ncbi:DVU_1553 family AMP-dependent CoA ligase [Anaerovorax odorimutans]|uniref:DVU_1553 family AMP-dependent CoA ligase n=1 Tax=Anaerovorax odorimutans TaxID=109327 RepID=UPI000427C884|nr:AMP-binding protein [Anaerovorax odorimutans]
MIKRILDPWFIKKIGLNEDVLLTRELIEEYQLKKLRETLLWAKKNSKFYKERLKDSNIELLELKDMQKLPFVTSDNLREEGTNMLCVKQNDISRIVTLDTSGTTDKPKRVYYTEEDQELTVDFFNHGMRTMIDENDVFLILLPHERPGSVGDLLSRGIEKFGARTVRYGLIKDFKEVADLALKEDVTAMVGAPSQIEKLAQNYKLTGINTVLLSVEYVSKKTRETIKNSWDSNIYEHYGMTEMGLGGAVSCWALEGYHVRECDLFFEIINPETGEVLPDGEYGEVVFTTLTRKAMPFIRYRTGDISCFIKEPCKCGSVIKRLARVGDRGMEKGIF